MVSALHVDLYQLSSLVPHWDAGLGRMPVCMSFFSRKLPESEDGRRLRPYLVQCALRRVLQWLGSAQLDANATAAIAARSGANVVFSSNALAILGLRSLYFLLASAEDKLVHLNKGLGLILVFVGVKMVVSHWYHLPTVLSLVFIAVVLAVTVAWSLRSANKEEVHSR